MSRRFRAGAGRPEPLHGNNGGVTGDSEFTFVRIPELAGDMFDRFYHVVLEPAFPPEELEDIDGVRAEYYAPSPAVPGVAALRSDGDPVAGALGDWYGDSNVVLLSYLAVRADCRGTGIGSVLLDRALSSWRELLAPAAILAEIEDPRGHAGDGPHGDPAARLRFYERAGAKVLPLRYFQPSISQGAPRVRGMLLICLDPWRASMPKDVVLAFLDENMAAAEGPEAAATDPEYLALRGEADAWPDEVPLWPLSRATELPSDRQPGS
jgi:GNAT superfamily N-acetyltransferase